MRLFQAARLSAAFLLVAFTIAITFAVLTGGGISKSYRGGNADPRTVLVQLALVSSAPSGTAPSAVDVLRDGLKLGPDGAQPIDHAAFAALLDKARQAIGPTALWLTPALAAQHNEEATLSMILPAGTLELIVSPSVLDKNVIRTGLALGLTSADESSALEWSSAITLNNGAVIAVDLSSVDPETGQPVSMLLVIRATIVTKKP